MESNLETDTSVDQPLVESPTPGSKLPGEGSNSRSDEELDNKDERVETEEAMLRHPEELRHLLMEYKTADMTMKDEIQFLQPLAEFYQQQYRAQPDLWMSGLRAHGLWIACSLRDPDNSDYIQSASMLMNSKLSMDELSAMNTENKKLLTKYRETHRTRTSEVTSLLSNIDSDDWSNNLEFMTTFTSAVKDLSDDITKDVKCFFHRLIDQSVESLGRPPPCGMAVIAIGSLARCETTSYSDIEYMFLIEEDSDASVEYFRQLALQTYYFLSMLGESNLKTYDIQELNVVGFADRCKKALRIDGLAKKAGNQPTGNEIEGSQLIFTVKQLSNLYQSIERGKLKGPEKGVPSDFVDMITHRTLIWSTEIGAKLYKRLEESLKDISHTQKRKDTTRKLLLTDMEEYSFLPTLKLKQYGHHEVKWDLYRYPSLLITGLNNVLDIKSSTNWQTMKELVTRGTCSDKTGVILSFLLASAIFTRVDCYNFYQEQNDQVTVFAGEENSPQYSCPRELFILMASYLFPLKSLMITELKRNSHEVVMPSFHQDTFLAVCITHSYCGSSQMVISEFKSKYGEEMMFDRVDVFLHEIPQDQLETLLVSLYGSHSLTERHTKLIKAAVELYPMNIFPVNLFMCHCFLLTNPLKALRFAQEHLDKKSRDELEPMFHTYLLMSKCYLRMKDFNQCEEVLKSAKTYLDDMKRSIGYTHLEILKMSGQYLHNLGALRLKQDNYEEFLRISIETRDAYETLYGPGVIHGNVSSSLTKMGIAYMKLERYPECLECYTRSLDMECKLKGSTADSSSIAICLWNIGCVKLELREFEQALDFLTRCYRMRSRLYSNVTPTHPDITRCALHIAQCHYAMSDYTNALQCYKKQYKNLIEADFVDRESLAICTNNIGMCQVDLEEYQSAVESYGESLKLYREINHDGKYGSEVTGSCHDIALCHYNLSDYTKALQWYKEEYTNLIQAKVIDGESLAICTHNIGMCHEQLEDYGAAIESCSESLKLYKEINHDGKYGSEVTGNCRDIASCHYDMSDYTEALQWYKEEYTHLIQARVIDRESLAICTHNIGMSYKKVEDYQLAIESYSESLKLYRRINHDGKYDRDIEKGMKDIEVCTSELRSKAAKRRQPI